MRHHALIYSSDQEYVARAVPFLRDGLSTGEGAIVAHTRSGLALMRAALGTDADAVTFVDVGDAYTRPARTLAAYHDVYASMLERFASVRAVADVQIGPDPGEWDLWAGYEAAFNPSFAHLPLWVLCSYDTRALPSPFLDLVWRTHPGVVDASGWTASDRFEDPGRMLRRLGPTPVPLPGLRTLPAGGGAGEFREHLAREMTLAGVPAAGALDLLLAATEVVVNAVRHGGGVRAIRAGRSTGRFICEVVDKGPGFDDPAAGYLAPRPGRGAGLWVARRLTWSLEFFRAPDGFTTRLVL